MGLAKQIRTVTQLKTRTKELLDQVNEERAPVIITQEGVARGVLMDVESYDELQRSIALLKLVREGEEAALAGRVRKNSEVVDRLAKKYGFKLGHGKATT
jgi:prevent-host-death family protein